MRSMATAGRSRLLLLPILPLLVAIFYSSLCLCTLTSSTDVSEETAETSTCSTDEEKQFSVTVVTSESLGLRLSEKLEVLEFVADPQGRSRAVEASGLAEIGDRLIQVNEDFVGDKSLVEAVTVLREASLPKVLRFQTHDGRCQVVAPPSSAPSQANARMVEGSGEEQVDVKVVPSYDYLLLSLGEQDTERTYYGVLSADGKPPDCTFRHVAIAYPFDACSPLSTNATNKYVLVPTISGCPMHQKASFVQDAGAQGVIFVQYEGGKPQQIKVPSELPKPIVLPLVMVTMDSGMQIVEQLANVHPTQTLQLRFVFSDECALPKYQVHPQEDPYQQSIHLRIETAVAGFLSLSMAASGSSMLSSVAYEFLKPAQQQHAKLPLGKHDLSLIGDDARAIVNPCQLDPVDLGSSRLMRTIQEELQGSWVAVGNVQTRCSMVKQLEYFASLRVGGVIFGDPAFPKAASSISAAIAAAQVSIPFVFVSSTAMKAIKRNARKKKKEEDPTMHIQVEFTGESEFDLQWMAVAGGNALSLTHTHVYLCRVVDALRHHWGDLAELADPLNWPSSETGRDRLFHRILKDHATIGDHDTQRLLERHERYDALVSSYWNAQRFYIDQTNEEYPAE